MKILEVWVYNEKLQYTVEDKAIAELFGRQNLTTKESAIIDLVKNAYDSGSPNCLIEITDTKILISDCGKGMDDEDISMLIYKKDF